MSATQSDAALVRELRREIRELRGLVKTLSERGATAYALGEATLNAKQEVQGSVKVSAPIGTDLKELRVLAREVRLIAEGEVYKFRRAPRSNGT